MFFDNSFKDKYYNSCDVCPRNCGVDRNMGPGPCGESSSLRAAIAGLYHYEEPFLSGTKGSGTVFFSGCSLKCVFCQNFEISRENTGYEITPERLAEIFLEVQDLGAHNLNLVTGTHFTPSISEALIRAKIKGLTIPVVWNSSAYEKPETLSLLNGLVDIWLPDLKTLDPDFAEKYLHAKDYPDRAKEAIAFMAAICGEPVFEDGLMKRGVAVRHLQMPGHLNDTKAVLKYLHDTYKDSIWISLMNQYTPLNVSDYPEINRPVSKREYDKAVDYAIELGITNCLIQEGGTVAESFIPSFDGTGIIRK